MIEPEVPLVPSTPSEEAESPPAPISGEYRFRRWAKALGVGGTVAFGAVSTWMATVLLGRGDPFGVAFAVMAALAAGIAVAWVGRWRRDQPDLVLSEDGILDASALGPPRFIPWHEIQSVAVHTRGTTIVLCDDTTVRPSGHRRVLNWLGRRPQSEYPLPTLGFDVPSAELGAWVRDHHEALLIDQVREGKALPGPE